MGAARVVFSEVCYDAATIQAIASRADLTRPAINHYFVSKKVLYDEVVENTSEMVVAAGIARAGGQTRLVKRLTAFCSAITYADSRDSSAAALLVLSMLESQRHPELSRNEHNSLNATRPFVRWAVTEAIASGELTTSADVGTLVELLVAVMWGMSFYAGYLADHEELTPMIDTLEQLLANNLWHLAV